MSWKLEPPKQKCNNSHNFIDLLQKFQKDVTLKKVIVLVVNQKGNTPFFKLNQSETWN